MKVFNHNSGHIIEISGADIYYEEAGNPEHPALIMLHGGFEDIEDMDPIAAELIDKYHIIGIDTRGHGKSTPGNVKLTYERIQFDVEQILKYLKIKMANIIGFSDGGIVAYRLAAAKKIRIDKMITMGASWSRRDVIKASAVLNSINPKGAKSLFKDNYKRYMSINPEPDFNSLTQSIVRMWLDKTGSGHPDKIVTGIRAKTLLIRGDNDFLVSTESLAELSTKIKKTSFLNVPFAGHKVFEDQPEIVFKVIRTFLNS